MKVINRRPNTYELIASNIGRLPVPQIAQINLVPGFSDTRRYRVGHARIRSVLREIDNQSLRGTHKHPFLVRTKRHGAIPALSHLGEDLLDFRVGAAHAHQRTHIQWWGKVIDLYQSAPLTQSSIVTLAAHACLVRRGGRGKLTYCVPPHALQQLPAGLRS